MTSEIKPVAWYRGDASRDPLYGWGWFDSYRRGGDKPLYTADALAAAREEGRQAGLEEAEKIDMSRQKLTDAQMDELWKQCCAMHRRTRDIILAFGRAIESELRPYTSDEMNG